MYNRHDTEIILISATSEIVSAFDIPAEAGRRELFAERKGATRKEFYAAEAVNRRIDEVFEVNALDYENEIYMICDGDLYEVVRSYPAARDRISLSCERRAPR